MANEDGDTRLIDSRLLVIAYSLIPVTLSPFVRCAIDGDGPDRFANARNDGGDGVQRGAAINVPARLIEIYVLIHSRTGVRGEHVAPTAAAEDEWVGKGKDDDSWRGKEFEGLRSFRSSVRCLIYSDVPRPSAT